MLKIIENSRLQDHDASQVYRSANYCCMTNLGGWSHSLENQLLLLYVHGCLMLFWTGQLTGHVNTVPWAKSFLNIICIMHYVASL